MNRFEDLVVELKEENLLESTVIDIEHSLTSRIEADAPPRADYENQFAGEFHGSSFEIEEGSGLTTESDPTINNTAYTDPDTVVVETGPTVEPEKPANEKGSYQKRAVSEVSGLQMVEHVLTGVEREYMKIVPNTFDDFKAKRALHTFLNVAENVSSEEHTAAEFTLMQETEAWCTALCERDREVSVSSLRLYCENSRPALSSQALVAMARFYRNLPYSEDVRSKFDFTITRLFSRPADQETRVCLFTRDEMLNHVKTLYKEWSSIPLYTADNDESKVLLTALSFDDLAIEAESASTFDQLITSDFFSRLRLFKESISELFFAPNVTAAAIECNIRVGNAYVNLIHRERVKMNDESIESKYGDLNEQAVSDAAARTLQLVELLRGRELKSRVHQARNEHRREKVHAIKAPAPPTPAVKLEKSVSDPDSFRSRLIENALSVNKWLLLMSVLLIAASVSVWVWANYVAQEDVSTAGVETVVLEGSFMAEYIKSARISNGTLYGVLSPTWDVLPKERRQEFAQKVLQAGRDRGYSQVNLISKGGRMAAYASATRLDIIMP